MFYINEYILTKKSKNRNIVVIYLNIFSNVIIPVLAKVNFKQPLLHSLMSHNPSEIILICWYSAQETFLYDFFYKSAV